MPMWLNDKKWEHVILKNVGEKKKKKKTDLSYIIINLSYRLMHMKTTGIILGLFTTIT